ncbi:MAG: hypothetical protein K2P78_15170 [Gemmataceae bacterium]|nr:hypothetical protein [Gemmataceae bacterium]
MPNHWHVQNHEGRFGPFTAKQIWDHVAAGQIGPADQITAPNGRCVAASQIRGLFEPVTAVQIEWAGYWIVFNPTVEVRLDGEHVSTEPFKQGFCLSIPTSPGRHLLSVQLSLMLKREKQYVLDVSEDHRLRVILLYNAFWGNFLDEYRWVSEPTSDFAVNGMWEEEWRVACCPHCGAEWAGVHVGEKVIGREQVPKTVVQTEHHSFDNPHFNPLYPTYAPPQLHGETYRHVQVMVTVVTVRDYYQCEQCGGKWKNDRTAEHTS